MADWLEDQDASGERALVTISKNFWLAKTPVTQGQWLQVMQSEPWQGMADVMRGDQHPAVFIDHEQGHSQAKP